MIDIRLVNDAEIILPVRYRPVLLNILWQIRYWYRLLSFASGSVAPLWLAQPAAKNGQGEACYCSANQFVDQRLFHFYFLTEGRVFEALGRISPTANIRPKTGPAMRVSSRSGPSYFGGGGPSSFFTMWKLYR